MIKNNILFHNVDELEETNMGLRMHRYSLELSKNVNDGARNMHRYACGCELRFVTDAKSVKVTIYSEDAYGEILVYKGDNMHSSHRINFVGVTNFTLSDFDVFNEVNETFFNGNRFSKNVWRVYFHGFRATLIEVDTFGYDIRPPKAEEMPKKTILSYGSSISHGASTMVHSNAYAQTFARLNGMDCLIKGTGGSCYLDKVVADDFAKRDDWDIALLELGINMANPKFSKEVFDERFNYFADTMINTGKKLIFVTIFTCSLNYTNGENSEKMKAYNEIIRKKYEKMDKTQCLLIEGTDILTNPSWLMCDCIHPSTEGHMMMGINLYNKVLEQNFI